MGGISGMEAKLDRKSALMVSYLFPPLGGIGVQRPLKFVRYLGECGWNATVLTVSDAYSATPDPSLLREIPTEVEVIRISDPVSRFIGRAVSKTGVIHASLLDSGRKGILKRAARKWLKQLKDVCCVPDEMVLWALHAAWVGIKLVKNCKLDCIYTTSGPNSCHLAGLIIHWFTGVKWVADFRDPWTDNQHFYHTGLRRWFETWLEKQVFANADSIVTVTVSFKTLFETKFPQCKGHIHVIRNGVDPNDFPRVSKQVFPSSRFTIFYAGILYPTRSPNTFLQALSRLIRYLRIAPADIRVQFAGVFDYPGKTDNWDLLKTLGLENMVEVLGYMPHHETLRYMQLADALLLIGERTNTANWYVPGKLYEYFYAKKPILALLKEGEAADLIREAHAGLVVDPSNPPLIADAIMNLYRNRLMGRVVTIGESEVEKYSRAAQARQLADIMQKGLC